MEQKTFIERHPQLRKLIAGARISNAEIERWSERLMQAYDELAAPLPEDSAWKHGKIAHVRHAAEETRLNAPLFGLNEQETHVLSFLAVAHDVGRLEDERRRLSGELVQWRHGTDSARIVRERLDLAKNPGPLWRAILLAIEHHSDVTMPSLRSLEGDVNAFALTALLRDFDKLSGFDNAAQYVGDPAFKRKQIETNWRTQRASDPTWGEEKGRVEPASLLDQFLAGQALVRRDCQSYEAYMLQYLAWVYDLQTPEVCAMLIARGGPGIVLQYLLDRLRFGAPDQFVRLYAWARTWQDGILFQDTT